MASTRAQRRTRAERAFAPAAITNFFRVVRTRNGRGSVGATGGGYVLSKGVYSGVTLVGGQGRILSTVVNGDPSYVARTTRTAVRQLVEESGVEFKELKVDQKVEVPIGCGFGASAASAISAVLAAGKALDSKLGAVELAQFAHEAEIREGTGLGTVSVTYRGVGAGAIVRAGRPGVAEFLNVDIPSGTKIVTASLAPFDKRDALGSKAVSRKINVLGREAQTRFLADPTFDSLASAGEEFSRRLGLETPEVKKFISSAKGAGADYASQNMIGYAVHAIVAAEGAPRVASTLRSFGSEVRVDVFDVGTRCARVLPSRRR